ncbi:alpha/beta fold hydrolase [Hwanghaeella sp. 1Z406]|uniref:alpha/beta fold hydrolase n=1 Tax=Hwanghaeella sp. 1Z406 TaxID=3402811 RepID=UPI00269FB74C
MTTKAPAFAEKSVRCAHVGGFHDMVYSDWGPRTGAYAIVCVHGLTRNGRDFDRLAMELARTGYRVLAPDIVGRGRSDHLGPLASYEIAQYINDITVMLAAEGLRNVDWVGTSMGGLIGMSIAVMTGHPIKRLLLNDVGPHVPKEALQRIGDYVGVPWRFDSFDLALNHVRQAYAPFGLKTEEDWRYLAELSLKQEADGKWVMAYDTRIADAFKNTEITDIDLWPFWAQISTPTLVLRGEDSDLLSRETAEQMTRTGPKADLIEVSGCGHAPALMDAHQIGLVMDWVRSS